MAAEKRIGTMRILKNRLSHFITMTKPKPSSARNMVFPSPLSVSGSNNTPLLRLTTAKSLVFYPLYPQSIYICCICTRFGIFISFVEYRSSVKGNYSFCLSAWHWKTVSCVSFFYCQRSSPIIFRCVFPAHYSIYSANRAVRSMCDRSIFHTIKS